MRYLIIVSVFLGLLPAAAMDLCKIDSVALISIKAKNTDNWFGKDKGETHFCFKDLVADLAGIGFGIAVLNLSNH
jgi:hypothetical protein